MHAAPPDARLRPWSTSVSVVISSRFIVAVTAPSPGFAHAARTPRRRPRCRRRRFLSRSLVAGGGSTRWVNGGQAAALRGGVCRAIVFGEAGRSTQRRRGPSSASPSSSPEIPVTRASASASARSWRWWERRNLTERHVLHRVAWPSEEQTSAAAAAHAHPARVREPVGVTPAARELAEEVAGARLTSLPPNRQGLVHPPLLTRRDFDEVCWRRGMQSPAASSSRTAARRMFFEGDVVVCTASSASGRRRHHPTMINHYCSLYVYRLSRCPSLPPGWLVPWSRAEMRKRIMK